MAEKVEIRGGDQDGAVLENAASEATLLKLVELIDRQRDKVGGSSGRSQQEEIKLRELYNRSLKDANVKIRDLGDSAKDTARSVVGLGKDLASMAKGLIDKIDVAFSSSIGIALSSSTPKITQFTDVLAQVSPVLGRSIGMFGRTFEAMITDFKDLSQVGADLGDSLLDIRRQAGQAGVSIETLKKVLVENSIAIATLGGSTTEGAKRFVKLNGQLERQFGPSLSKLGISTEEAAANTAEFMIMQQRLGKLNQQSDAQLLQGAVKYNLELDKLARATGVQRSQIQETVKQLESEVRFRAASTNVSIKDRAAFGTLIASAENADPSGIFAKGIKDIFGSGGELLTEASKNLAIDLQRVKVDARQIGADFFAGGDRATQAISAMISGLKDLGESGKLLGDQERKLIALRNGEGIVPGTMALLARAFADAFNAAEAAKEQAAALASTAKTTADLERAALRVQLAAFTGLEPALRAAETVIGQFAVQLQPGGSLLTGIQTFAHGVAEYLKDFLNVVSTQGPSEAFKKLWNDLMIHAVPYLEKFWADLQPFAQAGINLMLESIIPKLGEGIFSLFTSAPVVAALVAGIAVLFSAKLAATALASLPSVVRDTVKTGKDAYKKSANPRVTGGLPPPPGEALNKGLKAGAGKLAVQTAKLTAKFIPGLGLVFLGGDAMSGAHNSNELLDLPNDPTTGKRRSSTTGEMISGAMGNVIGQLPGLDPSTTAKFIAGALGAGPSTGINDQSKSMADQRAALEKSLAESEKIKKLQAEKSVLKQPISDTLSAKPKSSESVVQQLTDISNTMMSILDLQRDSTSDLKKIVRNTRTGSGNLA